MVGPPGAGKTMLAARLPGLLPDLGEEDAVEVTAVHSVAGTFDPAGGLLRRPPFDMPYADSEIVFGPLTEYTGLRFALFLLAEYAGIVVVAGLTTVLFLGGWRGPFLEHQLGWLWTLIKVLALSFLVIWLRVAYPRLREDQLQRFAWLVLLPLALLQLAVTAVGVVVLA